MSSDAELVLPISDVGSASIMNRFVSQLVLAVAQSPSKLAAVPSRWCFAGPAHTFI